jgi:hypothetical protein
MFKEANVLERERQPAWSINSREGKAWQYYGRQERGKKPRKIKGVGGTTVAGEMALAVVHIIFANYSQQVPSSCGSIPYSLFWHVIVLPLHMSSVCFCVLVFFSFLLFVLLILAKNLVPAFFLRPTFFFS